MAKPFQFGEFAGHIIGAAAGDALAAGGAAALTMERDLALHFAGVGAAAGAIGGVLGDLLGYALDDVAPSSHPRIAALAAFVVSALSAAPMVLLVYVIYFEARYEITPLIRGIAAFTGFMASATGRLLTALTTRAPGAATSGYALS